MNETDTSIPARKKSGKVFPPIIPAGLVGLFIVLLVGIYLYLSDVSQPEFRPQERSGSDRFGRQEHKSDESSPLSSEAGEETLLRNGPEDRDNLPDEVRPINANPGLPELDESNRFVHGLFATLSNRPEYAQWIAVNDLIPKITMVLDNLSRGRIPASRIRHLAPKGPFSVLEKSPDQTLMDPRGYHRYDIYADTLASLDLSAALRIYSTLQPLFDSAYQQLGYPEAKFEPILRRAIKHLLAAPVLSGEVVLVRPSVMYRFADPDLESLSQSQKQLIRMGPRNTRIIQLALRNFLTQLDGTAFQSMHSEGVEE